MNILTKWLDGQQPLEVRYSFIGFMKKVKIGSELNFDMIQELISTIHMFVMMIDSYTCSLLFGGILPWTLKVAFDADHTLHYQTWWILRHHRQYFDVPQSSSWDQDCNLDCWTILHTNLNHMKVMMDIKVVCSWVLAPWFPYAHTNTIGTIPSMIIRVFNARTSWSVSSIC